MAGGSFAVVRQAGSIAAVDLAITGYSCQTVEPGDMSRYTFTAVAAGPGEVIVGFLARGCFHVSKSMVDAEAGPTAAYLAGKFARTINEYELRVAAEYAIGIANTRWSDGTFTAGTGE